MTKIDIKAISLSDQKILEDKGCFIELYPDHLKYVIKFLADEPIDRQDKELGWAPVENDFVIIAMKKSISGIERCVCYKPKRWRILIMISGFPNDIQLYFKTQDEADAVLTKLQNYLLL